MFRILATVLIVLGMTMTVVKAQTEPGAFQGLLQENFKLISRSSARTVSPVIEQIQQSGFDGSAQFLDVWQNKNLWFRKADETFFYVSSDDNKTYQLIDIETGTTIGEALKKDLKQIRPNSGVRALLDAALVKSRLVDPDVTVRRESLVSVSRNPKPEHLSALRDAIELEQDAELKEQFQTAERLLTMQFEEDETERVAALRGFAGSLALEVRANLNPILSTRYAQAKALPTDQNIARVIVPGETVSMPDGSARAYSPIDWFMDREIELTKLDAYDLLVKSGAVPARVSTDARDAALLAQASEGSVGGIPLSDLSTEEARHLAYAALAASGLVQAALTQDEIKTAIDGAVFYAVYNESNAQVTTAAAETLNSINASVRWSTFLDLMLDAISLASIYFLAAIGLAITFGVMRVINMAHGEFIMMGAYSGYVVQQIITNYTLSIIIAIPVAFIVTFAAGVALERLVIRHLYNRPLETLLATFGVSIALQQLAKNIFGTQARPLTAPDWLDGALVINDVVSISWIRIAIFVLGMIFFIGLWWTLNKTRLGLETRAVTQNPRMAASMGINPDRINMLTFGLGSGIAGIAGVAIGLYAKVTSELGSDYIVQSFMTVVIGGVGSIWGTLAGAGLIGILQKFIEGFNPSNTLAAQTFMIIFIIIFIQFRPRGLIALKGRAAEA